MPAGIRPTTCQHTTSSRAARSEVVKWGGLGVRMVGVWGVAQGWVFISGVALGFMHVGMVRGTCRNGQTELE